MRQNFSANVILSSIAPGYHTDMPTLGFEMVYQSNHSRRFATTASDDIANHNDRHTHTLRFQNAPKV